MYASALQVDNDLFSQLNKGRVRFIRTTALTMLSATGICSVAIASTRPDVVWAGAGHVGVLAVAVSPDGQTIASSGGADDRTVKLWRRSDGALIRTVAGNLGNINSLAFTPDGQYIVTGGVKDFGGNDPCIKVRRVSDGEVVRSFDEHFSDVSSVAVSPDGTKLASGSADQTAIIRNISGGDAITLTGHTGTVFSVAWSADSTMLVTGSGDNRAKTWNASTGALIRTFTGHTFFVSGAQFTPDAQQIVTSGWDGKIKQWNADTGAVIRTISATAANDTAYCLAMASDGLHVAAGLDNNQVRVWNTSDGSLYRTLTGHASAIDGVAFVPGDAQVVSGSFDSTVRLFSLADSANTLTIGNHHGRIDGVAYSPNGALVASCSADLSIRLWNANNGAPLRVITGHTELINHVDFSPDSSIVASCAGVLFAQTFDNSIRLWNVSDGGLIRQLTGHNRGTASIDFSQDGTVLVSCGADRIGSPLATRSTIKLWNVATGALIPTTFPNGASGTAYNAVQFSPDGLRVAVGETSGFVRTFNVATGQLVQELPRLFASADDVAYSPDGDYLAAADDVGNEVTIFRLSDGVAVHTLTGHIVAQTVAYTPDGASLLTGSGFSHDIRVWDTASGNLLDVYDDETGDGSQPLMPMAVSPDGHRFVYGRPDATIIVANVPSATPCAGALRGDANCDSVRDMGDVEALVLGLIDLPAYEASHPGCQASCTLDMNGDQAIDGLDVPAFVDCLVNGSCP